MPPVAAPPHPMPKGFAAVLPSKRRTGIASSDTVCCSLFQSGAAAFRNPVPAILRNALEGFLEGRIRELENILKKAQVIKEDVVAANIVAIGRTVIVREEGTDFDESYTIVGSLEADPSNGRVSNESPLGKALLGKKVGAKTVVNSPSGEIVFKIMRVE